MCMGHSTPNRTVWKILICDFLHFLTFFSIHQKLLLVNFEIFLITGLKDIEFRFFVHNFFKSGPNSTKKKFEIFVFLHTFYKKIQKDYPKCFYMRFLSLKILILKKSWLKMIFLHASNIFQNNEEKIRKWKFGWIQY